MSDVYCIHCDRKVPVWIRHRKIRLRGPDSNTVIYDELYAVCQFCNEEVYTPKVNDMNVERRAQALSAN